MNHPLHYQSSFEQQQQQQQQQKYQQQTQMMMQGSPHIGSPMMNQNSYMQHQQQNRLAHHPTSPLQHQHQQQHSQQYLVQPQQQPLPQQYQMPNSQLQYQQQQQQMQHQMQQQQQYQQQQMQQPQMYQQQPQQYQHHLSPRPAYQRSNSMQHSYRGTSTSGPRAKCDQVIYEAIAKACEIAVRGRCTDLADDAATMMGSGGNPNSTSRAGEKRRSFNYYGGNPNQSPGSNHTASNNSTSSRFNIEVDEVPTVRHIVSSWKRSPHVPLRLDIYYEHDGCYDREPPTEICEGQEGPAEGGAAPAAAAPQRELLERWCIDYVPSSSSSSSNHTQQQPNSISSPYNSPSSSPYSSRIMTGVSDSKSAYGSGGGATSNISQLRQVCKRIVVLLRSLHCLTRMLPSYRLKCLLLSNIANGGAVTVNGLPGMVSDVVGAGMANHGGGAAGMGGGMNEGNRIGWGTIGFSIHIAEYEREPSLPSPSFQRQSFPSVPTPFGSLNLQVLYDAALNPHHMMSDLVERRTGWLQRHWLASAGGLGVEQPQQQQYYEQYEQPLHDIQQHQLQQQHAMYTDQNGMPGVTPTSTQPIPIAQFNQQQQQQQQQHQQIGQQHQIANAAGGATSNNREYGSCPRSREYNSCPPNALMMGGPASLGYSAGRTRAVSDFIISDYHNSPKLRPVSHTSRSPAPMPLQSPLEDGNAANTGVGMAGGLYKVGNDGDKRVMSGLSLAMMNEEGNNLGSSPAEPQRKMNPPNNDPQQQHHTQYANNYDEYQQQQQQQHEEEMILQSFGSPVTRAAFHNPPPLLHDPDTTSTVAYSNDANPSNHHNSGGGGTHFFHRHAGYGYGYNGSNVQFGNEKHELPPPPPPLNSPPLVGSAPSGPPRGTFTSTPPTPPLWPNSSNKNARSRSPSVTRSPTRSNYGDPAIPSPHLSPGAASHRSDRSGTPPTSVLASRYQQHPYSPGGGELDSNKSISTQQQNRQRTASSSNALSSQSMQLLAPVTSLDVLAKSPFLSVARKTARNEGSCEEGEANFLPFILGSQGTDIASSIPRMVSNERTGNSSAVSTLGGGAGSSNPLIGLSSVTAGGYNSANSATGTDGAAAANSNSNSGNYAVNSTNNGSSNGSGSAHRAGSVGSNNSIQRQHDHVVPKQAEETDELPFAVDDDPSRNATLDCAPALSTSSNNSPTKSNTGIASGGGGGGRTLLGSSVRANNEATLLERTIGNAINGDLAEITSSLAVSSLHHRCATDGKVRLKMFENNGNQQQAVVERDVRVESSGEGKGLDLAGTANINGADDGSNDPSPDFASIRDQLSDFRSFGASLIVGNSRSHDDSSV
eukprot:CAMPEP_0183708664 /NCGR_PEP_ID=MMETSP0737-20130205/4890_1 /TAXON_ID=385413 /ORGANISM="Thalassiosira miniscula, Strain CCMP1093" /LENGTH=1325 /DNA_ID=CAMNT_0025936561 /DNA_START=489 /DNA_END=4466 /DNA_ORIENTATION=+